MTRSGVWRFPQADIDARVPAGISVAVGAVAVIVAAFGAVAIPAQHPGWRLSVMVATVAMFAALTADLRASAAVAGLGWLVVNGFLVDRLGELAWHGPVDLYRLLLLVTAAGAGVGVGAGARMVREWRARWRMGWQVQAMAETFHEEAQDRA